MTDVMAPPDRRTRAAVRRLLEAVDRSVAANREVEAARAALERSSQRRLRLCGVPSVQAIDGHVDPVRDQVQPGRTS